MAVVRNITPDALSVFRSEAPPCQPGDEVTVKDENFVGRAWPKSTWEVVVEPEGGYVDNDTEDAYCFVLPEPEDKPLADMTKAELLAAAEDVVHDGCVLASNTSALSVTELAAVLRSPGRFLGMHFFNPVPVSALVELVLAPGTTEATRAAAVRWTHALGKQDVVVKDSPGFASSRLGLALGLEAIRMVEEGVADPEAVDTAMRLGYRHPMGPLRLTDVVGLDVRLAIAEHLHTRLGERFAPPRLLREKVARGELGRKTGQGFYRWQ